MRFHAVAANAGTPAEVQASPPAPRPPSPLAEATDRYASPEGSPPISLTGGTGETDDGGSGRALKRARRKVRECKRKARKTGGAIIAPTRTDEGFKLASGNQRSCMPDALYNGYRTLYPALKDGDLSLQRLRKLSIPELGNVLEASWESLGQAIISLNLPVELVEVTKRVETAEGGPIKGLLNSPPGVYLVAVRIVLDGAVNKHCVMLSTLPEKRKAPYGKLIDNHSKMKPVYIEKKDLMGKKAAVNAFIKFLRQNPAVAADANLSFTPAEVYELRPTAPREEAAVSAAPAPIGCCAAMMVCE